MATSLQQQLQSLKIQQKDEIVVPSRSKMSFLFEIKKAANIDDQTIFYLFQKGMQEIQDEEPSLHAKLSVFLNDLLNEKSLSFYRGTQTQGQLKAVDQQLEQVLRILSPYYTLQAVHKVIEYLVRIYEVHSYLKHSFIMSFLPYFETAYFIKAIQLCNLKEDQWFSFLNDFAYQGQAIDSKIMVRALSRNHGVLFAKYCRWLFEDGLSSTLDSDQQAMQNMHHKFVGAMLIEVIGESKEDQVLLLNVLPFISQSLNSGALELRSSGLLAIGHLCSNKSLSNEYIQAFVKQVIKVMKSDDQDEGFRQRSLSILMVIVQYQKITKLAASDLSSLLSIPRISKFIGKISKTHDISTLLRAFVETIISEEADQGTLDQVKKILKIKDLVNLKTQFVIVSSILNHLLEKPENCQEDVAKSLLSLLKEADTQSYNQTLLYHLKQTQDPTQKSRLRNIIEGANGQGSLFETVGDIEYSLLSALGSARKSIKMSALNTLTTSKTLSAGEAELIQLFLAQIISRTQDDEELMSGMLSALGHLLAKFQAGSERQSDVIFESLEKFIANSGDNYSDDVRQKAITISMSLQVGAQSNLIKQSLVAFFHDKKDCHSQFASFLRSVKGKKLQTAIVENIGDSFEFLSHCFKEKRPYYSHDKIDYVLSQIIDAFINSQIDEQARINGLNQVHKILIVLQSLGQGQGTQAENYLSSLMRALPKYSQMNKSQPLKDITLLCIGSLIQVTLIQKQQNKDFNLALIHKLLLENQFDGSDRLYCEYQIQVALSDTSSGNQLQRIFAILYLIDTIQSKYFVDATFMLPVILMLISDKDATIRKQTFTLAKAFTESHNNKNVLDIFIDSEKPKQTKKKVTNTVTQLKPGKAVQFLEEICRYESEIIQDQTQVTTAFNKSSHQDVFEMILKTFLDWPTYGLKMRLLEILSLVEVHTTIFTITLSDSLNKLYSLKATSISNEELPLLLSAGRLICRLSSGNADAESKKAIVLSLVLPFLHFTGQNFLEVDAGSTSQNHQQLEDLLLLLVSQCLLDKDCLAAHDDLGTLSVVKAYLKLQRNLKSSNGRALMKASFVEKTSGVLKGDTLSILLNEMIKGLEKASKTADDQKVKAIQALNLELLMETLAITEIKNDHQLLPGLFKVLGNQVDLVLGDNSEDSNEDLHLELFLSIELTGQVCQQIIQKNSQTNLKKIQSLKPSSLAHNLLIKAQNSLKASIESHLETTTFDQSDPFNQFLMVVDSPAKDDGMQLDTNKFESVQRALQIIRSLSGLLLNCQELVDGSISKSSQFLSDLSDYIQELLSRENSQQSKNVQVTNLLFRFYHQESIKSVQDNLEGSGQKDLSDQRNVIVNYIKTIDKTLQNLSTYNNLQGNNLTDQKNKQQEFQDMLSQLLLTADLERHGHIAALILIMLSKNTLTSNDGQNIDSPLIQYAKNILILALQRTETLKSIQNLIFTLVALPLSQSQEEYTNSKFKIIDSILVKKTTEERSWILSMDLMSEGAKGLRQIKFMVIYLLENWLTSDSQMKSVMAQIAGGNPSEEVQNQFLNCYLLLGIMKDGLSNYLSDKEYKTESDSVQAKASTKRLSKRVHALLEALNLMVSHEIHSSMVLKIMTLNQPDILSLKTSAVSLLLSKTPDFSFSLSVGKQAEMVGIYEPLLLEAKRCLTKDMTKATLQKSSEKQSYAGTLFALISKTASKEMPQEIKDATLQLSINFIKNQKSFPLPLSTQLILAQSKIFEVYQADILEHLPTYISQLLEAFERAHTARQSEEFFFESFTSAALKSSLSIITLFAKFLNVDQLEDILKNVLIVDKAYDKDVEAIFTVLSSEGPKSIGLKKLYQAVFNSYDEIILQKGAQKLELQNNISNVALRYYGQLLKPVVMRMKKEFCAENFKKISQFFKEIFTFPQQYYKSNSNVDILQLDQIEDSMVQAFQQFVIKLNEDQLGPTIHLLIKWASKPPKDGNLFNINMHRQIIVFKALSGVVEALGEYAVPFIKLQLTNTTEILQSLVTNFQTLSGNKNSKKRTRVEQQNPDLLQALSVDGQGHTMKKLLVKVCENITLNFKHDTGAFIQGDIFEQLAEPLVAELVTLNALGDHFNPFIEDTVKPLVFEMNDRINNESLWIKMNSAILMKTRPEHPPAVRQAALKTVEHMFTKLGERYLVVLNETLPFVSESLEDENPDVEALAKLIVKKIEAMTGESIQDYLK